MTHGFGIIGTGMIARFHAKAIAELENARLVGCFNRNLEKAQQFAEEHECQAYETLEEMLADPEITVVTICTPSGAHMEPAVAAAEAGKHLIIEKPLEITLQRCDAMIEAAEKAGVKLAAIFPSRYHKAPRRMKQALEDGRFGKLTLGDAYVKWYRSQEYYDSGAWRGTWDLDGGGALMNQAIHSVDLLTWLMGPVKSIQAFTDTLGHERIEVEDVAVAALRFENGAMGVIEATTTAYPGYLKKIELHGTAGSATMEEEDLLTWDFVEEAEGDAEIKEEMANKGSTGGGASDPSAIGHHGHKELFAEVLTAIENDEPLPLDGREGRRAVEIILGIYESAKTGKLVTLPLEQKPAGIAGLEVVDDDDDDAAAAFSFGGGDESDEDGEAVGVGAGFGGFESDEGEETSLADRARTRQSSGGGIGRQIRFFAGIVIFGMIGLALGGVIISFVKPAEFKKSFGFTVQDSVQDLIQFVSTGGAATDEPQEADGESGSEDEPSEPSPEPSRVAEEPKTGGGGLDLPDLPEVSVTPNPDGSGLPDPGTGLPDPGAGLPERPEPVKPKTPRKAEVALVGAPALEPSAVDEKVGEMFAAIQPADVAFGEEVKPPQMTPALFKELRSLAESIGSLTPAAENADSTLDSARQLLGRIAKGHENVERLAGLGYQAVQDHEETGEPYAGIVLAGTVEKIANRGGWWVITLKAFNQGDQPLTVVTRDSQGVKENSYVAAFGCVVAAPKSHLKGYNGNQPVVTFAPVMSTIAPKDAEKQ